MASHTGLFDSKVPFQGRNVAPPYSRWPPLGASTLPCSFGVLDGGSLGVIRTPWCAPEQGPCIPHQACHYVTSNLVMLILKVQWNTTVRKLCLWAEWHYFKKETSPVNVGGHCECGSCHILPWPPGLWALLLALDLPSATPGGAASPGGFWGILSARLHPCWPALSLAWFQGFPAGVRWCFPWHPPLPPLFPHRLGF